MRVYLGCVRNLDPQWTLYVRYMSHGTSFPASERTSVVLGKTLILLFPWVITSAWGSIDTLASFGRVHKTHCLDELRNMTFEAYAESGRLVDVGSMMPFRCQCSHLFVGRHSLLICMAVNCSRLGRDRKQGSANSASIVWPEHQPKTPQLGPDDAMGPSSVSSFPLPKRSDESGTNEAATLHVGLLLAVRI